MRIENLPSSIDSTSQVKEQQRRIIMKKDMCMIYARQSSGKEEESESIEMQKSKCLELAKARGMKVIGVYEDANSSGRLYPAGYEYMCDSDYAFEEWFKRQTGEKKYRPGLGEIMRNLKKVSYIIVDDLTRLARPVRGSYLQCLIQQELMRSHVKILLVKGEEINYESFVDRLMANIQMDINDNQICIQSQKSRDAMDKLRDSGIYPTIPKMFGIKYIGKKKVEIIPECAECIQFIYENILKCRPYNAIIYDVNRKYGHLFKGTCHPSTFRHIATQPFYCGYMRNTEGVLIQALQMEGKSIVSYDVWQNVQRLLEKKRVVNPRAQFRNHPFTGLIHCANCGAKLVSGMDVGKEFYLCVAGSNSRREQGCRESRININLVRDSEHYTGLRDALCPILVLALYKYLDDKQMTESEIKNLAMYEAKKTKIEENMSRVLSIFTESGARENDLRRFAAKSIKNLENLRDKIARIKILSKSDSTKAKFYDMCFGKFEDLLAGNIDDGDYELLLRNAVNNIISANDHIIVDTIYGKFRLDRYMDKKFRNFPKYTWRKTGCEPDEKDLSKCVIEVTYIYGSGQKKILNVDFGHMRIYEKK